MFARRIARSIMGAVSFANPAGVPRLRRVIRVRLPSTAVQMYVVSIGNGPSAVLITNRLFGSSPTTS